MTESEKSDQSPEESLSNLPPTPVSASGPGGIALGAMFLAAAGAGAILLVGGSPRRCMGSTRSVKLQWEERQLQMEQAEREYLTGAQLEARPNAQSDDTE